MIEAPAGRGVLSLVVPDPDHWTLSGVDVRSLGYRRADAAEHARLLVVPERVPEALRSAVLDAWSRLPEPRRFLPLQSELDGILADELLGTVQTDAANPQAGAGEGSEEGHSDAADDEHEDMMAIVGEPSADGLVMESMELEIGPLSTTLPGGLVAELCLDGDIVVECALRPTLAASASAGAAASAGPAGRAALAYGIARVEEHARGSELSEAGGRRHIAAVELERVLAHAVWFRRFAGVLGWTELFECSQAAVEALLEPRRITARAQLDLREPTLEPTARSLDLDRPRELIARLTSLAGSRRFRARARARGETGRLELERGPIGGPTARAAGLARDVRIGDPLYAALGFEVQTESAGDAVARSIVRAREMRVALGIALAAASERGDEVRRPAGLPSAEVLVEGSCGPLRIGASSVGGHAVSAPGADSLLVLAGGSVRGLELGAALAGLASFDLSPWQVPG